MGTESRTHRFPRARMGHHPCHYTYALSKYTAEKDVEYFSELPPLPYYLTSPPPGILRRRSQSRKKGAQRR